MVRLRLKKKMSLTAAVLSKQLRVSRVMPNGNTEVERRTNVCFSENITSGDVDMEALISDILSEFRYTFKHRDTASGTEINPCNYE
uniref:Uncharacterized protein n=1 Tax=Magallana gigas TaxID=29159 RepID=K1QVI6_MAGGI